MTREVGLLAYDLHPTWLTPPWTQGMKVVGRELAAAKSDLPTYRRKSWGYRLVHLVPEGPYRWGGKTGMDCERDGQR